MSRLLVVASLLLFAVQSPARALQIEIQDISTAALIVVSDGGVGDDVGTPGVPDGVVGLLSVVLGDFMLQDIQCREAILPGASVALVIEGITPGLPGTLHNLATPSTGELGARDVSIECRSSAIVPSIPNWRGRVHYVAEADDDLGDELSLLNIIHWLD